MPKKKKECKDRVGQEAEAIVKREQKIPTYKWLNEHGHSDIVNKLKTDMDFRKQLKSVLFHHMVKLFKEWVDDNNPPEDNQERDETDGNEYNVDS